MPVRKLATVCLILLFAFAAICCDSGSPSSSAPPRVATSVRVTAAADTLRSIGAVTTVTAIVLDAAGRAMASKTVSWRSSDTTVATVSAAGGVLAVGNGSAELSASVDGVQGSARIVVRQAAARLRINPDSVVARAFGQRIPFSVEVLDALGTPLLGAAVSWASSDTTVATVSAAGEATSRRNGLAVISARAEDASASGRLLVDVRGALRVKVVLSGAGVDPDGFTLNVGDVSAALRDSTLVTEMKPGTYPLALTGVADHCLARGDRGAAVVQAADTARFTFSVRCTGDYAYDQYAGPAGYELRYVTPAGEDRLLVAAPVARSSHRWSPDGARLVFSHQVAGNWDVYTVRPDGSDPVRLTNHPDSDFAPAWSPDGTRIAYYSQAADLISYRVLNADGTGDRELARHAGWQFPHGPLWSPSGEIVFASSSDAGRVWASIWSVRPDGSDLRRLTNTSARDGAPIWSANASEVVFPRTDTTWHLMRAAADLSGARDLARPGWEIGAENDVTWSPTGNALAYVKLVQRQYQLWLVDVRTGAERSISAGVFDAFGPAYSQDGCCILFSTLDVTNAIAVTDADGSNLQLMRPGSVLREAPRPRPRS